MSKLNKTLTKAQAYKKLINAIYPCHISDDYLKRDLDIIVTKLMNITNGDTNYCLIRTGLCNFVSITISTFDLTKWPHFSGNPYYPIPNTYDVLTDKEHPEVMAYDRGLINDTLYTGEQLKLRQSLALFVAKEITELRKIAEI